jgi:hypothetical protein
MVACSKAESGWSSLKQNGIIALSQNIGQALEQHATEH